MAGRSKKKPEYNPELQFNHFLQELSPDADRCRTYKIRQEKVRLLKEIPSEENLW